MLGVDVSVYSGEIPVGKFDQIRDAGYDVVVVGLWHGASVNPYANRQAHAAFEAGLHVAAYVFLATWSGKNGANQVYSGLEPLDPDVRDSLNFVAIDCEADSDAEMINGAIGMVNVFKLRPVIYTAKWWWEGKGLDFSQFPLWDAYYDEDSDVDFPSHLYGGWTKVIGEQWQGTTDLFGINVDLNWFDDEFIIGRREEVTRLFVQLPNKPEVYERTAAGLVHVTDPGTFTDLGGQWDKVLKLDAGNKIWKLPVYYPGGLPEAMK
ncbi:MAG: hypothetical protein LUO93_05990 [Methanomicrobiales archaeon]|nr:hypothetical protein [Methanomicrobiales archaeon]